MNTSQFQFGLTQEVSITLSGEVGQVRARAEWATGNISYFVAYKTKQGEYREAWLDQDLLEQSPKHTTVERGVEPEFLAAVSAAMSKLNLRRDVTPHHMARILVTNSEISVADNHGGMYLVANPHFRGENAERIEDTLRRMSSIDKQ